MLGDDPLYIINGKPYRKSALPPNNTMSLDGLIEVLNPEKGKARYGTEGEDGVLILEGKTELRTLKTDSSTKAQHSMLKQSERARVDHSTKEIRIKITKNTTKEELDKIKKELKRDHNIDFNYSNIEYNASNEITGISLSYSGKGMNGSYRVEEDNGEGIEDFYFYMDTENRLSGFGSDREHERHALREQMREERNLMREQLRNNRPHRTAEERAALADRRAELEDRRAEMEVVREQMEERREEMEVEREQMRDHVAEVREKRRVLVDRERELARHQANRAKEHAMGSNRQITIYPNTTDAELEAIKAKFESEGMSFKYSRVKRNSNGEITRIKIQSNNNKGSEQSITSNAKEGDTIDAIVLDL